MVALPFFVPPTQSPRFVAAPLPPERVGSRDTRYPRVTLDEVVARQPEVVLLPDEPHAFTEADAEVFRKLDIPAAKTGRVLLEPHVATLGGPGVKQATCREGGKGRHRAAVGLGS